MKIKDFQPKDLDDAIDFILSKFEKESVDFLREYENDERGFLGQIHHFFGQNIRNDWYLWWWKDHKYDTWPDKKPEIVDWFNRHEIYHADDMSGIILTSVHRRFFSKDLELNEQIKKYHNHWLRQCGTINPMAREKN